MLLIFKTVFCETVFVCPQSPYRDNVMLFWILPIVRFHAHCMCHWPIHKHLDLSLI